MPEDSSDHSMAGASGDGSPSGATGSAPSSIGKGRFSNLPAVFFDSSADFEGLTREEVKQMLLLLERRGNLNALDDDELTVRFDEEGGEDDEDQEAPSNEGPFHEHVIPTSSPEEDTLKPTSGKVALAYDPDAEIKKLEEHFEKQRKKPRDSSALGFIHAIIVALLLAVAIRYIAFEAFKIPSGSMEPTLIGDPAYGDHVAVNKLAFKIGKPQRWDIVVFKKPTEVKNLIKRCVGMPNETLEISGGDVWANGAILRKPYRLLDQFLRPYFEQTDFSDALLKRNWRIEGDYSVQPDAVLQLTGASKLTYLPWERKTKEGKITEANISDIYPRLPVLRSAVTPKGMIFTPTISDLFSIHDDDIGSTRRGMYAPDDGSRMYDTDKDWPRSDTDGSYDFWQGGSYSVGDLCVEISFTSLGNAGRLLLHLSEGGWENTATRTLAVPLAADESMPELRHENGDVVRITGKPRFMPGARHTVSFMNIDDRLIAVFNGEKVGEYAYNGPKNHLSGNKVEIELTEGAEVLVHSLSISRDIFYTPRDEEYVMGPDEYFMLGDNSPHSSDSRYWHQGVSSDALIGRAFMVFWPLSRIRFFPSGGDND